MATMSPELILASYSCARRDHMVRLTRARPLSVSSARRTVGPSASLRMPTEAILAVGTRSVILSLTKLMTNSSSLAPATSCSSIATIWPTPWDGYTMNSLVLKPCRWVVFLLVIPGVAPSSGLRRTGVLATGTARCVAAREACDALRRSPAEVFLVRRVTAVVFFDLWRVFPATAFCVDHTSLVDDSSETTRKNTLPTGERLGLRCSAHFQ